MSVIGGAAAIILFATGRKPKKHGFCLYFEVGEGWGGVELGPVFICARDASEGLKDHELGHAIQNAVLGPFMPVLVSIPSALRYWCRRVRRALGKRVASDYDSVWFEAWATKAGATYIRNKKNHLSGKEISSG